MSGTFFPNTNVTNIYKFVLPTGEHFLMTNLKLFFNEGATKYTWIHFL